MVKNTPKNRIKGVLKHVRICHDTPHVTRGAWQRDDDVLSIRHMPLHANPSVTHVPWGHTTPLGPAAPLQRLRIRGHQLRPLCHTQQAGELVAAGLLQQAGWARRMHACMQAWGAAQPAGLCMHAGGGEGGQTVVCWGAGRYTLRRRVRWGAQPSGCTPSQIVAGTVFPAAAALPPVPPLPPHTHKRHTQNVQHHQHDCPLCRRAVVMPECGNGCFS